MTRAITAIQVMQQMLSNAFSDDANPDEEAEGVSEEEDYEASNQPNREDEEQEEEEGKEEEMVKLEDREEQMEREVEEEGEHEEEQGVTEEREEQMDREGEEDEEEEGVIAGEREEQGKEGLLLLAGDRSRGEATASLWDAESGRSIFSATMPLKVFHAYSRLLRFDDHESRPTRRAADKLAAVREVWDMWSERLPYLYNPRLFLYWINPPPVSLGLGQCDP
ncbi:piggyBac transposable element-derived protein 4-like [Xyrichtys novacula]|uniref:PiggyBac transposable element-derived protein 4-like n=1 Tax=Xyrichtys novacula TaxID=13765 RepID=A0AAV1HR04_XYRNO|nr:piggyBac transposable element-derived protein 4-like [Xyrichtys novacula]